jgi:hypothetical protein
MSDTLKCFEYLEEYVPQWIKNVEELEQKVEERRNEVSRVAVPVSQQKVRRTGSNESIRPGKNDTSSSKLIEITSAPQPNDMAHAQTTEQMLQQSRKRKTASLLTSVSTPNKYRSRNSIIVYYDSAVQEAFEHLVRNIGMGRNYIRKARMAARMEAMSKLNTAGEDGEAMSFRLPARSARTEAASGYGATLALGLRSARGPPIRPDPFTDGSSSGATDACTLADTALEKAQSFCEQGAHQFLRDGSCEMETSGAKASFKEIVALSEKEVARLRVVEQERDERRAAEGQKEQECGKRESLDSHPGLMTPDGAHIEADDDDGEDDLDDAAIPLPPFRVTTRT